MRVQHAWKLVEEMELNNLENKRFHSIIENVSMKFDETL